MRSKLSRFGQTNIALMAFLGSIGLLGVLIALLVWDPSKWFSSRSKEPLIVYCAAAVKAPVEQIAREYEQEFGVPVLLDFGASNTLLGRVELKKSGDLYLPADDSYLDLAREKDLIDETIPLAHMTPVLAVRKDNPRTKNLRSLEDLLRSDAQIAQADPDATAVGKLTRDALQKSGQWEALQQRKRVDKPTVNDVANDIKLGSVDAGIVWDATVQQYPELESVPAPALAKTKANISVAVLRSTRQPAAALHFARYLTARDKGLVEFERSGYQPVEGDLWKDEPQLTLLSGAMLRPAIEETITEFERREGVSVTRVYNGCGILVAQMEAGQRPDAYFACDKSFMEQVHDLFLDAVDVSTNQLVILVHKGNPHQIKSLKDLGKKGLRVGVGHEKQCALGVITQETLKQGGFHSAVTKNIVVQSPTGDMLVNQLCADGTLDAVIAYISNATPVADKLDAVRIDNIPCAVAVQPIAVGKDSGHKQLTTRLLTAIRSQQSKERFESNGFRWQAPSR